MPTPTAWEYTIIEIYANMPRMEIQKMLDDQGRDGWENYAIIQHPNKDPSTDIPLFYYYFKRVK